MCGDYDVERGNTAMQPLPGCGLPDVALRSVVSRSRLPDECACLASLTVARWERVRCWRVQSGDCSLP
jgi:hypothetical protein